jgi:MYXO-CTERM domain-containing protein
MKTLSKRLDSHFVACAVAAATAVVGSADAAIQMFTYGPTGIQVPANADGIYFNLTTGATGTSAAAAAGPAGGPWMNPYGSSTASMSWFATTAGGAWRGVNIGGYNNEVSNLGLGFVVGSSIPNSGALNTPRFNTTSGTSYADGYTGDFSLNADNYFGFRFTVGTSNFYGYGVMRMGATITERSMMGFAVETTAGASITTAAIPAPGAIALLGLAGFAARRRRS